VCTLQLCIAAFIRKLSAKVMVALSLSIYDLYRTLKGLNIRLHEWGSDIEHFTQVM